MPNIKPYIIYLPFQRRFPLNFFNENYIAGKKTEHIDQTEPDFALIIPEMDFPLNSS